MVRKQIYLSDDQCRQLGALSSLLGENTSALIRQAVDDFIEAQKKNEATRKKRVRAVLKQVAGIWADRDPKEFEEIRRSADRRLDEWGV